MPATDHNGVAMSLPARGVWIEISTEAARTSTRTVTPRKGSVD